jgi:hypothetical protein
MPMPLPDIFQNQKPHISCLFGLFYDLPSLKVSFALTLRANFMNGKHALM